MNVFANLMVLMVEASRSLSIHMNKHLGKGQEEHIYGCP